MDKNWDYGTEEHHMLPRGMEALAGRIGSVTLVSPPGYHPDTVLFGGEELLSQLAPPKIPSRILSNVGLTRGISSTVGREPAGHGLGIFLKQDVKVGDLIFKIAHPLLVVVSSKPIFKHSICG